MNAACHVLEREPEDELFDESPPRKPYPTCPNLCPKWESTSSRFLGVRRWSLGI
jgi:hypothetical protein